MGMLEEHAYCDLNGYKSVYLLPIGSLYDLAPAARAVIWLPIQIPNTGWGRSLSSTFAEKKKVKKKK